MPPGYILDGERLDLAKSWPNAGSLRQAGRKPRATMGGEGMARPDKRCDVVRSDGHSPAAPNKCVSGGGVLPERP